MTRLSSASTNTRIQPQIVKLAECDEHLSLIASDVKRLQAELTQFRADAEIDAGPALLVAGTMVAVDAGQTRVR